MTKKLDTKKKTKTEKQEIALSSDEAEELQMIVDRLAVQNPEGGSFERYLLSLKTALGQRPHLAAVLIDRLSKNPNPTAFRTFRALEGVVESSPYRRHIKQAAYRFSQRGFAAEKEEAPPKTVVLIQGEEKHPQCNFFLVHGTLWLVSALVPGGGRAPYSLITAFLEVDYESLNVKIIVSTHKFYREYLQKVSQHALANKAVEIPAWHAARLFFEMLDLSASKDANREVELARNIFKRYYDPERRPYVYDLMAEIAEPERHLPEIDIPEFLKDMDLTWLRFSKEDIQPAHEKLKDLESPLLVVPREVQIERREALLRSTADTLCTGDTRRLFQRYFEEQAMGLKLAGFEERANWSWIIAQHLQSDSPAGENPAAYQIVMYSIESYWPGTIKREQQEPEHRHEERRTESGIILP